MTFKTRKRIIEEPIATLREIEKQTGVSKATISRIKHGGETTVSKMKKLLPFMDKCPCCGARLNNDEAAS